MCSNCYHNDAFIDKKCGICRDPMGNPSRSRIAEKAIKRMIVKCEFDECNATMKYGEMQHHLDIECQAVEIECKYQRLGCNWTGPRRNATNHQHSDIDYDDLLMYILNRDTEISICEWSLDKAKVFKDTIINHDIFATFDFKSIWQDFDVESNFYNLEYRYINRFCGNIKKRFRLQVIFKINVDDTYPDGPIINIFCKISVECFQNIHRIRRKIRASIVYAQSDTEDVLISPVYQDRVIVSDCNSRDEYVSPEWMHLLAIEHNLMEANEAIKETDDAGYIRIFAGIK